MESVTVYLYTLFYIMLDDIIYIILLWQSYYILVLYCRI